MKFPKLRAKLSEMGAKVATGKTVSIGWNAGDTYGADRGGLPVAQIAKQNEYGGTFTIPEHTQVIYRSVNEKTGVFRRGGKFLKSTAKSANLEQTVTIPAHDITIPPRPFFRTLIAAKKSEWTGKMLIAARATDYDAHKTLDAVGHEVVIDLKNAIRDFKSPGNAASTIARKGEDNPLQEDNIMLDTAHHWVNE